MKIVFDTQLYDYDDVGKILGIGRRSVTLYVNKAGIIPRTIERKKYLTETQIKALVLNDKEKDNDRKGKKSKNS